MLCKHVQTSATHIKDIRQKTANLSDTHKRLLQCSKNFAATFSNTSKLTNFIALHVALHKSGPTIILTLTSPSLSGAGESRQHCSDGHHPDTP
ncbi:hypothetical protein M8J77_005532 [Diaphorina citri]|nr:hypothetical protein M8J77_004515 [Diaphorina citri]KAI5717413.1 hypothetical protein M8J77_005532 [Diaphorina citri]